MTLSPQPPRIHRVISPPGLMVARRAETQLFQKGLAIGSAEVVMRANWDNDDEWMAERAEWTYVPVRPKVVPIRRGHKRTFRGALLAFIACIAIWVLLGKITVMLVKWIP